MFKSGIYDIKLKPLGNCQSNRSQATISRVAANMFREETNRLIYEYDAEQLWIEPWGPNAFRVRATKCATMPTEDWALEGQQPSMINVDISISSNSANITN